MRVSTATALLLSRVRAWLGLACAGRGDHSANQCRGWLAVAHSLARGLPGSHSHARRRAFARSRRVHSRAGNSRAFCSGPRPGPAFCFVATGPAGGGTEFSRLLSRRLGRVSFEELGFAPARITCSNKRSERAGFHGRRPTFELRELAAKDLLHNLYPSGERRSSVAAHDVSVAATRRAADVDGNRCAIGVRAT